MFVVTSSLIEKLEEEPGLIDALAYSEHRSSTHYFVHTTDIHEQLSDSRDGSSSSVDNTLKIFANDQQNIMPDFEITGFLNTGDFLNQKEAPKDPTEQKKIERFSKGYNRIKNSIKALGFANKQILFTPGNHDCIRTPSKIDTQNFALYYEFAEEFCHEEVVYNKGCSKDIALVHPNFHGDFSELPTEAQKEHVYRSAPVACIYESDYGVTVVIGFNSSLQSCDTEEYRNHGDIPTAQLNIAGDFTSIIKQKYKDKVLVFIGCLHHHLASVEKKDGGKSLTQNARSITERLRSFGFQAILHGHKHTGVSYNISYHCVPNEKEGDKVRVNNDLAEPSLYCFSTTQYRQERDDEKSTALALIEIDYLQGIIIYKQYDCSDDPQPDDRKVTEAKRRTLPLVSASSTAPGAMRLKEELERRILEGLPTFSCYRRKWESIWDKHQVIPTIPLKPLELDDKSVGIIPKNDWTPEITRQYDLLFFIRKKPGSSGELEILLNHHAYREAALFSDWDTLLLPSFSPGSTLDFVNNLKWDLLRQLHGLALTEAERKSLRKVIRDLIGWHTKRKVGALKGLAERQLGSPTLFERLSPTWGTIGIMEYNLIQANIFNKAGTEVSNALERIPDKIAFDAYWATRPRQEPRRGFTWVPLHYWRSHPRCYYSNGDVMTWLEKIILTEERYLEIVGFWEKQGVPDFTKGKENAAEPYLYSREAHLKKSSNIIIAGEYTGKLDTCVDNIKTFFKKPCGEDIFFKKLRKVPLRGFNKQKIYKKSKFALVTVTPTVAKDIYNFRFKHKDQKIGEKLKGAKGIWPAQTYVSKYGLERVEELRSKLVDGGIDLFKLDGYRRITFQGGSKLDLLPPIIEFSREGDLGDIWLINDGIHRFYYAKKNNLPIQVVLVWDIPLEYPYYAFPTTWESVSELDGKPPELYTKRHRKPGRHELYYRNFGEVFDVGRQGGN